MFTFLHKKYQHWYYRRYFKKLNVAYSPTWIFHGKPLIKTAKNSLLKIGKNFVAVSDMRFNSIGVFQPVIIKLSPNATIKIGDDVGMSGCSITAANHICERVN